MSGPTDNDPTAVHDYVALNALVARIVAFVNDRVGEDASQARKAEAIRLKHQRDFGKLVAKLNSPGLDRVQQIADAMGITAAQLISPLDQHAPSVTGDVVEGRLFEPSTLQRLRRLSIKDRGAAEDALLLKIEQLEERNRKSEQNESSLEQPDETGKLDLRKHGT